MKTKKLIKKALKNPDLYTEAELTYLRKMKQLRKEEKALKKSQQSE